jgi:hypothetical protein
MNPVAQVSNLLWSLDISDGRMWAKWAGFYQAAAAPTIVW